MARYTEQKTFSFGRQQEYRAVIPDTGSTVVVEFWNGVSWVADAGSPLTSPDKIFALGVNVRLTPSVGHGFYIDEGVGL